MYRFGNLKEEHVLRLTMQHVQVPNCMTYNKLELFIHLAGQLLDREGPGVLLA